MEDYWDLIGESIGLLGTRRSAIRITLVQGINTFTPVKYAAILQDSGATFVEVKGYMYLGYSRKRLGRENMPQHADVRAFAGSIAGHCDYRITDENPASRVVLMERGP
jgi:tRNA wybutosine-synthesizing protein 1